MEFIELEQFFPRLSSVNNFKMEFFDFKTFSHSETPTSKYEHFEIRSVLKIKKCLSAFSKNALLPRQEWWTRCQKPWRSLSYTRDFPRTQTKKWNFKRQITVTIFYRTEYNCDIKLPYIFSKSFSLMIISRYRKNHFSWEYCMLDLEYMTQFNFFSKFIIETSTLET